MGLTVTCPGDNNDTSRPAIVTGMMQSVKCQVCSLKLTSPKDLDPKEKDIIGEVEFGPNILSGKFDEQGVQHYSIYLTDIIGQRLSDALANVSVDREVDRMQDGCCRSDAYSKRLATTLPENVTAFRLEVVPVLLPENGGKSMPAGPLTDVVVDWVDSVFVRSSHAQQLQLCQHLLLVVVLAVASWKG